MRTKQMRTLRRLLTTLTRTLIRKRLKRWTRLISDWVDNHVPGLSRRSSWQIRSSSPRFVSSFTSFKDNSDHAFLLECDRPNNGHGNRTLHSRVQAVSYSPFLGRSIRRPARRWFSCVAPWKTEEAEERPHLAGYEHLRFQGEGSTAEGEGEI